LFVKYKVSVEVWTRLENGIPKKLLSKNPGDLKTIEHLAETTLHKNTPLQTWDTLSQEPYND
jgi:hypothetical protein